MVTIPASLAPARRAELLTLLSEVVPVADRPQHDGPDETRPDGSCAYCPKSTGALTVFHPDPRTNPDTAVLAHLSCRRKALRRRHTANTADIY
jgi:hypothetical protein